MPIEEAETMGNWGIKVPVNENCHITQTNEKADVGRGAHVTTDIPGEPVKIHDYFDDVGNYTGSAPADR